MDVTAENPAAKKLPKISITAGYYAGFLVLGLVEAVLGPTLPTLASHTHSEISQISYLFSAHSLGYMIGSVAGGRLYDRLGGHWIISIALILMAGLLSLVPLIPLLWLLATVLLLMGIAAGSLDVGGNTLLIWTHGDKVSPFMNGLHFFFGLGAFLCPIFVAQSILFTGDINWAYWAIALLMLPVFLWQVRLPSPTAHKSSADDTDARVNSLLIILVALFYFLCVGAELIFGNWIYTYAVTTRLETVIGADYLNSAFWGALTVGRLISIPIATRFKPRSVLIVDVVGALLSISVVLIWPQSTTALWIGAMGMGLSLASQFPTTLSLAQTQMTITGKVTGLFFVGSSASSIFLPWLIGQFFTSTGPLFVMYTTLAVTSLAVIVLTVWITYSSRLRRHMAG